MQNHCIDQWKVVIFILRNLKKVLDQGMLYEDKRDAQIFVYSDAVCTGYSIFIRGNIISWTSKKQNVVVRSSVEDDEYRTMTSLTWEFVWVKQFLQELKFCEIQQMKMYCDNQATLHIASNHVFHERTKHIELDYHFIREKMSSKVSMEIIAENILAWY